MRRKRCPLGWSPWIIVLIAATLTPLQAQAMTPLGPIRHRLALPDARPIAFAARGESADGLWGDVDAIAGQPPGPGHPQGTVLVAQATAHDPSPAVTEWDLGTGAILRSTVLPLAAAQADVRLIRAGGRLHAFASRPPSGPVFYVRLDSALHVEHVERWGTGERPRVATDGDTLAILWSGARMIAPDDRGWQLVVIDALGQPLWRAIVTRTRESTFAFGNPLAFVSGRAFVLLEDERAPAIVSFSPGGQEQRVSALPYRPDDARLFESQGQPFVTDGCRISNLADGSSMPIPNHSDSDRHCAAFDAEADSEGRLVTAVGEVRSASFALEAHFADREDAAERRPFWCFGRPARLVVERFRGRVWLDWAELPQLPCRSSEGRSTQRKALRNSTRLDSEVPCNGPFVGQC